jgi:phage terminase large subunit-like protein
MTPTSTKPKRADPGQRAVNFFTKRLHLTDDYYGVRFVPIIWQEQMLRDVFGTLRPDGARQYQTAYVEIPKKNFKTTTAAGIALKALYDEVEHGAHVYSAGPTREQAGYIYRIASEMIDQCPRLQYVDGRKIKRYPRDKRIYLPTRDSFYQALSSDASYNDGINPSVAIIDEIHRHKNGDLIAVIDEGVVMRENPLVVMLTTAGDTRAGFAWEWHEYARQVAAGLLDDPSFYAVIYGAPDDADPWSEKTWIACNPAIAAGVMDIEKVRDKARKAKGIASAELDFRRLRLNQWVANTQKWLNRVHWDRCAGLAPNPTDLAGSVCYGGIDLGETDDFSAFVLVFPPDGEREQYAVIAHLYLPEPAIDKHKKMAGQLRRWAREGFITVVPREVMDDETISRDVRAAAAQFDLHEIGYDPWKMKKLSRKLDDEGIPMVVTRQSPQTMSEPCRWLETLLAEGRINHGGNPVLRWMADNAVVRRDASGNIRPDKDKSAEKIDGIVALVVALERAMNQQQKRAFAGVVT